MMVGRHNDGILWKTHARPSSVAVCDTCMLKPHDSVVSALPSVSISIPRITIVMLKSLHSHLDVSQPCQ